MRPRSPPPPAGSPSGRSTPWSRGPIFPPPLPPRWIGRAATGVSLSDLAAKGAAPDGLVIALQLPPGTPDAWARAVLLGAEAAAGRFGARVVGGDTKASPTRAVVSSALGWARPDRLAPRTAARPGERVVVTGVVGRGGVAARRFYQNPRDPRAHRALLDVRPRVAEGRILGRYASAMLDTSDGLAEAARLLASASRVGLLLDEAKIPWACGLGTASRLDRLRWGTFGGDYELLATLPPRPAVGSAIGGGPRRRPPDRDRHGHRRSPRMASTGPPNRASRPLDLGPVRTPGPGERPGARVSSSQGWR